MQANHKFGGKVLHVLAACIFFVACLTISCKDGNKTDALTHQERSASNDSTFKMNCLLLRKSQVQQWVDSGWTQSGSQKIQSLLIQFSFNSPNLNNGMKLTCFPGKSWFDVKLTGKTMMEIDTACINLPLTEALFGNNTLDLGSLNIIDSATGMLGNFEFIRFKPKMNSQGFLVFDAEVVNQGMTVLGKQTNPCPPCQYCNPPCVSESFKTTLD
jgi:hypothetical protein